MKQIYALLLLSLLSCSGAVEDALVGCYSFDETGVAELKVIKQGRDYLFAVPSPATPDAWQREAARRATPEELARFFRADAEKIKAGLVNSDGNLGFGIFHVELGEYYNGRVASTDYLATILDSVLGSVHHTECLE